jgi:hypothetical protein
LARRIDVPEKLSMAPSYFSSKMNIMVAEDLYPESLPGDEPEPLPQVRWPLAHLMDLLEEPDFNEARNVSAVLVKRVAERAGPVIKKRVSAFMSVRTVPARIRRFAPHPEPFIRTIRASRHYQ